MVWREHDAESRQHDIEAPRLEGKIFRISFKKSDGKAVGLGALAAALEKRPDIIGGDHLGETARRGECRIAVAGGDIENALAGVEIDRLAQRLADDLHRRADDGIVARTPGGMLSALDRREIDARELGV